jgi:hypothetical protein
MTTVEITREVRRGRFNRMYLSNGMWIIEDIARSRVQASRTRTWGDTPPLCRPAAAR